MFGSKKQTKSKWQTLSKNTKNVISEYFEQIQKDPAFEKELTKVKESISKENVWEHSEEWRICTYFQVRIEGTLRDQKEYFLISVTCDKQKFECECPYLEKAHLFSSWYRYLIVNQFYSFGPNWSDKTN
tara:strand:- start:713 stop:1099 length:387 start_codon:yes stop_codon:yes gene_type:complete